MYIYVIVFWLVVVYRVNVFVIEVCSIIRGNGIMNVLCFIMLFLDGVLKRNMDYFIFFCMKILWYL